MTENKSENPENIHYISPYRWYPAMKKERKPILLKKVDGVVRRAKRTFKSVWGGDN